MSLRRRWLLLFALVAPPGCAGATTAPPAATPSSSPALDQLRAEARKLAKVTTSPFAQRFLEVTARLPHVPARTLYRDASRSRYLSAREAAALPPADRAGLAAVPVDEEGYYETNYGTPLSYARPLDVLAAHGIAPRAGTRVLDFGYGYVGHLHLLASLGVHATGVDVDPMLRALYSERGIRARCWGRALPARFASSTGAFLRIPTSCDPSARDTIWCCRRTSSSAATSIRTGPPIRST